MKLDGASQNTSAHPNTAMSRSSKYFGKGEAVFVPKIEEEKSDIQTESNNENPKDVLEDLSESAFIGINNNSYHDNSDGFSRVTCNIRCQEVEDFVASRMCEVGHVVPLHCSVPINLDNDVDFDLLTSSYCLLITESLHSHVTDLDIGEYL